MSVSIAWQNIKLAYRQPKYYLITLLVAIVFYSFTALLNNIKAISFMFTHSSFFSGIQLIITLVLGYHSSIRGVSALTLLIISILLGMLFSLIIFKHFFFKTQGEKKKTGILALIGVILGALTPGCALCSVGIFYALGFGSAFITLLPFEGLEFSFIAMIILIISVYLLAKNLTYCKMRPPKKPKKKKTN